MPDKSVLKIGIVGLGLIGGSLAKCLAANGYNLYGVAHSDATLNKAFKLGIFQQVSQDLNILDYCDVIFVATPINKIEETFNALVSVINRPCIVSDVASIKQEVCDIAQKTFDAEFITFIGGHPMAGTEFKGIDNAFSELFDECNWVLCPSDPRKNKQLNLLISIIKDTGANIIFANPQIHDEAVALISHMPLLISMSLVNTVEEVDNLSLKELAYYLASSGFRDTTRLAGGNPELSYDMLVQNKSNVLKSLDKLEQSIEQFRQLLESPRDDVLNKFSDLANTRKNLYSQFGKNAFKGLSG